MELMVCKDVRNHIFFIVYICGVIINHMYFWPINSPDYLRLDLGIGFHKGTAVPFGRCGSGGFETHGTFASFGYKRRYNITVNHLTYSIINNTAKAFPFVQPEVRWIDYGQLLHPIHKKNEDIATFHNVLIPQGIHPVVVVVYMIKG